MPISTQETAKERATLRVSVKLSDLKKLNKTNQRILMENKNRYSCPGCTITQMT